MWRNVVQDMLTNILFVLFLCGIAVLAVSLFFYYRMMKQRVFLETARALRFRYYYRSYAIPEKFAFLSQQRRGRGRHAFNIFLGRHAGAETVVFDYKFNKGLGADKKWYYGSFAVMHHGRNCPSLRIYPKNMLAVLGEIVGYTEISLDGQVLSPYFSLFTTDAAFARSFLIAPLAEYLVHHPEESLELDAHWFALGSLDTLVPEEVPLRLRQLERVRSLLPL